MGSSSILEVVCDDALYKSTFTLLQAKLVDARTSYFRYAEGQMVDFRRANPCRILLAV